MKRNLCGLVYVSFADEERCRGIVIVESWTNNVVLLGLTLRALGLNPGGEMMAVRVPEGRIAPEELAVYRANMNRLITADEARVLFERFGARSIREHEAAERSGLS